MGIDSAIGTVADYIGECPTTIYPELPRLAFYIPQTKFSQNLFNIECPITADRDSVLPLFGTFSVRCIQDGQDAQLRN